MRLSDLPRDVRVRHPDLPERVELRTTEDGDSCHGLWFCGDYLSPTALGYLADCDQWEAVEEPDMAARVEVLTRERDELALLLSEARTRLDVERRNNDFFGEALSDAGRWKTRAEAAEKRVAELELMLSEAHRVGNELTDRVAALQSARPALDPHPPRGAGAAVGVDWGHLWLVEERQVVRHARRIRRRGGRNPSGPRRLGR
jgi:hypothetical protein